MQSLQVVSVSQGAAGAEAEKVGRAGRPSCAAKELTLPLEVTGESGLQWPDLHFK